MVASSVGLGLYLISNRIGQNEMSFGGGGWGSYIGRHCQCACLRVFNQEQYNKNLKLNNLLLFS